MKNKSPKTANKLSLRGVRAQLVGIQNKISSPSSASYLFFAFIIPFALMYLVYLSRGVHPFGEGSILVLDMNGQYVYFFESLRNAIYGKGSFLYTFFRALGGEYLGMYAYYLASPLSYIVALFPQDRILEALLTITLIKIGLCGFTFGFYLHKHSEHPNKIMVVAFSVMYALSAYCVVHQNNIMWIDAVFWLPIVTYSIEQLIKNRRYKLFVISLAFSMMSNYYIGYMVCIWCVLYYIYYFVAHGKEVTNPHNENLHGLKSLLRFGGFALLSAAISAFILLAAYYSLSFGKNDFSNPSWALKAKFDLLDFFTKFLPGAYDTVRPAGLPFVYCGLLMLIMLPVYFVTKAIKSREKNASLALIGILILCFIASPLDLIWHGFQTPNWLNYRYSFMLCFFMLVLAYQGFGNLRRSSEKLILGICAAWVLFVAICQKMEFETYVVKDEKKLQTFTTVWLTVIIIAILFAILCFIINAKDYRKRDGITAILASVICIEVFLNALGLVTQFDKDVIYTKYSHYNDYISGIRPVVEQIKEEDPSFYRMEKLDHRKYNDNMALGIRGLSNSTSTLNASTIKFLANMGYTSRSHLSQYQGGNPVSDSILGIKYVIDKADSTALTHYFDEVISGEKYDVYQNPYTLSLAYGVSENVNEFNFDDYLTYFEKLNALVGSLRGTESTPELFKSIEKVDITSAGCVKTTKDPQVIYTKTNSDTTATVKFTFVATEAAEYYFYTPSNNPKECSISVNGSTYVSYLGSNSRHIVSLGWYEPNETVTVTVKLKTDPLYMIEDCNYVWYLDREVFEESFADLGDNPQFIIDDEYEEDHLTGTITTTEQGTMIMTTIAFDEGWQVYVDGEQTEIYQTLDALIAFDIDGVGEHSIELKYSPSIYRVGMILSIGGILVFIILCVCDYTLKRTVYKHKAIENKDIPWVLEDFDEDYEQYCALPDEPDEPCESQKSFIGKLIAQTKKDKNKKH